MIFDIGLRFGIIVVIRSLVLHLILGRRGVEIQPGRCCVRFSGLEILRHDLGPELLFLVIRVVVCFVAHDSVDTDNASTFESTTTFNSSLSTKDVLSISWLGIRRDSVPESLAFNQEFDVNETSVDVVLCCVTNVLQMIEFAVEISQHSIPLPLLTTPHFGVVHFWKSHKSKRKNERRAQNDQTLCACHF